MLWQFKLESDQALKVCVNALAIWTSWQFFYGKMGKDGRILIPKVILGLLRVDKPSLTGYVIEVSIESA